MYVTLPSGQMPEITPYLDTFHAVNNKKIRAPSIAVSMFLCIASKDFLEDPDKHQGIRLQGYANFCSDTITVYIGIVWTPLYIEGMRNDSRGGGGEALVIALVLVKMGVWVIHIGGLSIEVGGQSILFIKANPSFQNILNWILKIVHHYRRKQHKNRKLTVNWTKCLFLSFSLFAATYFSFAFLNGKFC